MTREWKPSTPDQKNTHLKLSEGDKHKGFSYSFVQKYNTKQYITWIFILAYENFRNLLIFDMEASMQKMDDHSS